MPGRLAAPSLPAGARLPGAAAALAPALALALSLSLVLAGCGGSAPTKADVIARANAICSSAQRDIRAVPPPPSADSSPVALSSYLAEVVPIVEKEVSALTTLPRPAKDRALLDAYVSAVTQDGAGYRRLATAAADRDGPAIADALSALRASRAAALAARYGMTRCGGSAGTGVS